MPQSEVLLSVNNVEVIYNHVILVLKGVSLEVPEGGIVALLGGNGAGKTTTLKAISNLLRAERGEVTKGSITFTGERIDALDAATVVKRGLIQVMEGRHCFAHLTVEENLLTGAYTRGDGRTKVADDLDKVYGYFPRLKIRRSAVAGYTSGGEQQMTAIGRALMSRPKMILLDEPSLGLAPQLVEEIFDDRRPPEQRRECGFPRRRAEHQHRAALCRLRLHPRKRPRRDGWYGRRPAQQRGRQGILSRALGHGSQELPRHKALPPAQALARIGVIENFTAGLYRCRFVKEG